MDVFNVFLNKMEFADAHTVNGKKMTVLVDGNELLERDKAKMGTHIDGLYKRRGLIYVAQKDFGKRPAIKSTLTLDGLGDTSAALSNLSDAERLAYMKNTISRKCPTCWTPWQRARTVPPARGPPWKPT